MSTKRKRRRNIITTHVPAFLPDELAPPQRLQHAQDWDVEEEAGLSRQVVSSPVRKLLKASAITMVEVDAAARLREDHDQAFAASSSPLAGIQAGAPPRVDAGQLDYAEAAVRRVHHAQRYGRALDHLGVELAIVAIALVIERADVAGTTFRSVGASLIGQATLPEQSGAGKGALVTVCRELALFYGLKRRQWSV